MAVESNDAIQPFGGVIAAEHADAQLTGTLLTGVSLGGGEQRTAESAPTKSLEDEQIADERELAGRLVELVERYARQHRNEPHDAARAFDNKDAAGKVATTSQHLRQILGGH